jgi:hypothetical protein
MANSSVEHFRGFYYTSDVEKREHVHNTVYNFSACGSGATIAWRLEAKQSSVRC